MSSEEAFGVEVSEIRNEDAAPTLDNVQTRLEALIDDKDNEGDPQETTPKTPQQLTRRRFLTLSAGTAAGLAAADKLKLLSLGRAALSRPAAPTELPRREVAAFIVDEIWEKHFREREDVFPLQAWDALKDNIFELAKLYFEQERHQGESIENYFARFMDEFVEAAETTGLDPVLAAISFQVSGENNGISKYRDDIKAGQLQLAAGWAGRTSGHQDQVDSHFTHQPEDRDLTRSQKMVRDVADRVKLKNLNFPIKILDSPRISGPLTTGIHDIESICLAQSLLSGDDPKLQALRAQLEQSHPAVMRASQKVVESYGVLDVERNALSDELKTLEATLFPLLDDFFDNARREEAFTNIGVSREFIDDWHRANFSIPWAYLVTRSDESAFEGVLDYYDPEKESDNGIREENRLQRLQRRLLFDEIRNPLFLAYLETQASTPEQQEALEKVKARLDRFEEVGEQALEADVDFVAAVGPHELDSKFQLAWGMAYMKSLQNIVEQNGGSPSDPHSKNSIAWMAFQMLSLREFTPIFYTTPHGRDAHPPIRSRADPSAQDLFTLEKLHEAVAYSEKEDVLPARPEDDIHPFIWFLRTFDHYRPQADYLWHDVGRDRFEYMSHYMHTGLMNGPYSSIDRALGSVSSYLGGFEGDIHTPLRLSEAREMQERQIIEVHTPEEIYAELERIRREGSSSFCELTLAPGSFEFTAPIVLPPNVNFIFNGSPDTKLHFPPGTKSGFIFSDEHTEDFSFYVANMDIESDDTFSLVNARNIGDEAKPSFVIHNVGYKGLKNKDSTVIAAKNSRIIRIMESSLRASCIVEVEGSLEKVFSYSSYLSSTRKGAFSADSHAIVANPHHTDLDDDPNVILVFTTLNGYGSPFKLHNGLVSMNGSTISRSTSLGSAPRISIYGGDFTSFPKPDVRQIPKISVRWPTIHLTDLYSLQSLIEQLSAYPEEDRDVQDVTVRLPESLFSTVPDSLIETAESFGFVVKAEEPEENDEDQKPTKKVRRRPMIPQ